MAILLDFEKVREDETEVEYIFGFSNRKDRRLVIHKQTQEGRPLDGNRDSNFGAVFVKIVRSHRDLARWPKMGSYEA